MGRNRPKTLLVFSVCLLTIGFAAVAATLTFTGNVTVGTNSSDFNVVFTNAETNDTDSTADIINNGKEINFFTRDLEKPGDSVTLSYEITNQSENYDVRATVELNDINDGVNEYFTVSRTEDWINGETNIIRAGDTANGTITITLTKLYEGSSVMSIEYTLGIVADALSKELTSTGGSAVEEDDEPLGESPWYLSNDVNGNGKVDFGDELSIGEGETAQSFYVYSIDNKQYRLLSKYNLEVGYVCTAYNACTAITNPSGLQSSHTANYEEGEHSYGTIRYGNANSYENSNVKNYTNAYRLKLNDMGANIAENNATVLSHYEITNIFAGLPTASIDFKYEDYDTPEWISTTTFWSDTYGKTNGAYMSIKNNGLYLQTYTWDSSAGIRPVIVINHSDASNLRPASKEEYWKLSADNNSNGVVDIGDEVTFTKADFTQSFYIYGTSGSYYKLLSKYNIMTGYKCNSYQDYSCTEMENPSGIQDPRAKGAFVDATEDNPIYGGVSPGEYIYLTSNRRIKAEDYGDKLAQNGAAVWGCPPTLLKMSEVNELTGGSGSNYYLNTTSGPEFLWSTSYLLQDGYRNASYNTEFTYYIHSSSYLGTAGLSSKTYGIRPVVFLPQAAININQLQ